MSSSKGLLEEFQKYTQQQSLSATAYTMTVTSHSAAASHWPGIYSPAVAPSATGCYHQSLAEQTQPGGPSSVFDMLPLL